MNKNRTFLLIIIVIVLLTGSLLASCGRSVTPSAGTTGGKELFTSRCSACHSLSRATSLHQNSAGWTTTVQNMVAKGAKLNAQEQQLVIDYLAQTYP